MGRLMKYFDELDEVFIHDDQREAIEKIDLWLVDAVDKKPGTPHVLFLSGESGVGKSYLTRKVIQEISWQLREAKRKETADFIKVSSDGFHFDGAGLSDLFSHRASFGENQDEATHRLFALTMPLILAVDEMGLEKFPITDIFSEGICTLMDKRDLLYTICITNLSGTAFAKRYEPRIRTRMLDASLGVLLGGEPWRNRKTLAETEIKIMGQRAEMERLETIEREARELESHLRREQALKGQAWRNAEAQRFIDSWEKIKNNHGETCDHAAIIKLKVKLGMAWLVNKHSPPNKFYCPHGHTLESLGVYK